MDSSLQQVWEGAAGNPFVPLVGKDSQFFVGFSLLLAGILLSGFFGLSRSNKAPLRLELTDADRSLLNIPLIGIPASLAIG
jgi:hypothetical protein